VAILPNVFKYFSGRILGNLACIILFKSGRG